MNFNTISIQDILYYNNMIYPFFFLSYNRDGEEDINPKSQLEFKPKPLRKLKPHINCKVNPNPLKPKTHCPTCWTHDLSFMRLHNN